jgi:hypothetical protein
MIVTYVSFLVIGTLAAHMIVKQRRQPVRVRARR